MEKIKSLINPTSSEFKKRSNQYRAIIEEYHVHLRNISTGGEEKSVRLHKERGKLLARERIDLLVDPNSPFLELSAFAAFEQHDNRFPSAGIITGVGYILGREAIIVANDATVKGGTYIASTIKKHIRAQEIALQNNLPCVYLVDSGGIFLSHQAEVFADRSDFGRIFYNQAKLSANGIPQISIVLGSCTAGGAYVPAMSDETIIVRNQGTIFLGGPPLVKAATGEIVTAEELGGSEVHTSQSGVADHLAENEQHAMQICRDIFKTLPKPDREKLDILKPKEPAYPVEELYGILPISNREQVDGREVIARLADKSEFHEFKRDYGKTLITGFSRIMGFPIGILASNGILYSESALKGTHFIELCNFRKIPILFLQNITGFMVGKKYENSGIARDGAKMVHAVATANVPKFTLVFGGSFGAGNYAMAGRAYDPQLLLMVPSARIAVMGGEQAANVLSMLKQEQVERSGKNLSDEELESIRQPIRDKYNKESSAYYSSSRLWDDGIIDPIDLRKVLAIGISMSLNRKFPKPKSGVYRM